MCSADLPRCRSNMADLIPAPWAPPRSTLPERVRLSKRYQCSTIKSCGTIFPSNSKRARGHLLMKEVTGKPESPEYPNERRSPDDRIIMLSIADTGFHIYYRFTESEGCWFLHAIHDKST